MKTLRVAVAALNQTPLDWTGNARRIRECWEHARQEQVAVMCLPELCLPGYGCEDRFLSPSTARQSIETLKELLPYSRKIFTTVGLPVWHGETLLNVVCVIGDGRILGFRAKSALARDGVEYEARWFTPWPAGTVSTITVGAEQFPIGDLSFHLDGIHIGFEICEECWRSNRPGSRLQSEGAHLILNPSASYFSMGKQSVRRGMVEAASRDFRTVYLYANMLGCDSGRIVYDGHCLIGSEGAIIAETPCCGLSERAMAVADVGLDPHSESPSLATVVVVDSCSLPSPATPCSRAQAHDLPVATDAQFEECTSAITLGLLDYLRRSHSQGYVVSLSGGADSSAVATLCAYALRRLANETTVAERVVMYPHLPLLHDSTTANWNRALLTCVFQGTRNNSKETRLSAQSLAREIGSTFLSFELDDLVARYVALGQEALGRRLEWSTDDITLQNVQARARVPGVWLIANSKSALLLSTSNRSEVAVGYATMDGDTAGGLSPIAGLDKSFLRRWISWAATVGPRSLFPVSSLAAVASLPPSAELRPLTNAQADEDDLMPYDVLNLIELSAIRDRKSPLECYHELFPRLQNQFSSSQLRAWIAKFYRLWARNQWKRERYAPSFHLDDHNLDPRSWCRFPIFCGNFEYELEILDRDS